MSSKKVKIKADTTMKYLQIFNGMFELTDTELTILAAFIDEHRKYDKVGVSLNMFDTVIRKAVAETLERNDYTTLNNFIKSIRVKGAIRPVGDGGRYELVSVLRPMGEDEIVFKLVK